MGRADLKTEAIERIDELIIGPLLNQLDALGDFTIPADARSCDADSAQTHSPEPVPFALFRSTAMNSGPARRYTETDGQSNRHRRERRVPPDRVFVRTRIGFDELTRRPEWSGI